MQQVPVIDNLPKTTILGRMHYKDFITKYCNKHVDFDGAYGNQCTDLFRFYCRDVLGISQPKGVNGAKDFWTNYQSDPNLYNNFDRIANTLDFIPQPGDVWIWTAKYNPYGHVAITSYGVQTKSSFECFSQNDPTNSVCKLKTYQYLYVYGVLRPKDQTNIRRNKLDSSDKSGINDKESESMDTDGKLILYYLDCPDYQTAEAKLTEHLGKNGKKCAYGDASGNDTGGHLGAERRKVKLLETQVAQKDAEITRLNGKVEGVAEAAKLKEVLDAAAASNRLEELTAKQKRIEELEKQLEGLSEIEEENKQLQLQLDEQLTKSFWEVLVDKLKSWDLVMTLLGQRLKNE